MSTMAMSASKKRPRMRRSIRISTLLVVVMVLTGALINFIPVTTFYFGSYITEPYQNTFSDGSSLTYYGTCGLFINSTGQPYSYGFKATITDKGRGQYSMETIVYKLVGTSIGFNINNLPSLPFSASQILEVYNHTDVVNQDSNPFLSLLLPNGTGVKTPLFSASISSNNISHLVVRPFLGYPAYHNLRLPAFDVVQYVHIGTQYALANMKYSQNFSSIFHYIYPGVTGNDFSRGASIIIGSGNSAPQQDWVGWIYYGFEASLPLNLVLLGAGLIISIIAFRQMR